MDFSERLKLLRSERNESRESMAKILQVSKKSIYKWENNKIYPDIEILIKISNHYPISLDKLFKEDFMLKNKVMNDSKVMRRYKDSICLFKVVILIFVIFFLIWLY